MGIDMGTRVEVTTAQGERVVMRALGGPEQGRDFEVVWVTTEDEFIQAEQAGEEADSIPWPVEAVQVLQPRG
jgi:hypothetical protein